MTYKIIDTVSLAPLTRDEIKERTTGQGLPKGFDETCDISRLGLAWALVETAPDISETQVRTLNATATDTPEGYVIEWTVRDKTQEEVLEGLPFQTATEARRGMVQWIDSLTDQILALYPAAVRQRWAVEESAARAVKAGTATDYQLRIINDEGGAKGRSPEEHADAVIANADRYLSIADQINKLFLATDKALAEATSPQQYQPIFEAAQAQARPLAQAYGLDVA